MTVERVQQVHALFILLGYAAFVGIFEPRSGFMLMLLLAIAGWITFQYGSSWG